MNPRLRIEYGTSMKNHQVEHQQTTASPSRLACLLSTHRPILKVLARLYSREDGHISWDEMPNTFKKIRNA